MTTLKLYADDLILFAHIVDAGSFTRASDLTGLPKSTLSRRLGELENDFGERLMQRSTRRLVLTEFGERMLEHARRLVDESEEATALALHQQTSPQGTLRVSFPPEFNELSLDSVVAEFVRRYPEVRLELDLSPRRVDIVAERFDVAVRAATQLPDDSSLVARQIIVMYNGLYANPDYIKKHGRPEHPRDLLNYHGLVLVTSGGEQQRWELTRGDQRWEGLPLLTLSANSLGLQQALCARGLGIVALSDRFAAALVDDGRIERILPDWNLPPTTVWCVTPGRKLLPQRSTAFIDVLKAVIS